MKLVILRIKGQSVNGNLPKLIFVEIDSSKVSKKLTEALISQVQRLVSWSAYSAYSHQLTYVCGQFRVF